MTTDIYIPETQPLLRRQPAEHRSLSIMSSSNYATTGSLNYFLPPADGSRLYTNINADSNTGKHGRNWTEDHHVVDIENVRGSEDQYKLNNAGFQFGKMASRHTRFLDDKEVEAEYYPECIELFKKLTGASSVVIFDHSEFATVPRLSVIAVSTVNHMDASDPTPPTWAGR